MKRKGLSMRKLLLILLVVFLIPCILFASPPPPGFKEAVEVKGESVTVKWPAPEFRPRCVVWMQDFTVQEIYYVSSDDETITIERKGKNKIPTKLMVVPADNSLQPKILDIPVRSRDAVFSTEAIADDEVFFWGITPEDHFPPPFFGLTPVMVSVRLLRNKSIYSEFYGAFLWKIKQDGRQNPTEPFYFSSDRIGSVSSRGFTKASDVADALCRIHTGGDCPFVFETTKDSWGKSFQIDFTFNPKAEQPIY